MALSLWLSRANPGTLQLVSAVSSDLQDFLALLVKHEVAFVLVGGHAMAVHGVPRYTKDLDIWLERSVVNAGRLLAVLRDFGFGNVGLSESDLLDPDAVIQLGYEPNRIDLLTSITGVDFAEAHRDAVVAEFAGCKVRVLSRQHLIANKRAVARARDLIDAAELEQP